MCVNGRFVTNRYTGHQFFVKCGHCKACQQEKAIARTNRIRHEYSSDYQVYFGTLTYNRFSVPYVRWDELKRKDGTINVYRQYIRKWSVNKQKFISQFKRVTLQTVYPDDYSGIGKMKFLVKGYGKIGVIYYKDIQDFYKRLRVNLERDYGLTQKFKIFSVSELGGKTQRPHFHFILFYPRGFEKELRLSVIKSWPYDNRIERPKSFQLVSGDPAGYVSSYVNCGSNVSTFHERYFKPKHSHSKYFGHGLDSFQLPALLEKIDRGALEYIVERSPKGCGQTVAVPIPSYVINRYFPKFKGYSKLNESEVYHYLSTGFKYDKLFDLGQQYDWKNQKYRIEYTKDDILKITVRLKHAYEYFHELNPDLNCYDYARYYCRAWNCYKSFLYKSLVTDDEIHPIYKYDNLVVLDDDTFYKFLDTLSDLPPAKIIDDPNEYPDRINRTAMLEQVFDKYTKQKDVSATVQYENDCLS